MMDFNGEAKAYRKLYHAIILRAIKDIYGKTPTVLDKVEKDLSMSFFTSCGSWEYWRDMVFDHAGFRPGFSEEFSKNIAQGKLPQVHLGYERTGRWSKK
jgi:hypothetical protein